MDNNPKPMKDFKPVETVDNAADQFRKTQQAQYESMERASRDRVLIVENHNQACPRLQDELQKRLSISRVTAESCAPKISACRKSTSRLQLGNTKSRRKNTKNNSTRTKIEKGTKRKNSNRKNNLKNLIGTCPQCLSKLRKAKQTPFRINRSIQNIFTAKEFDKSYSDDDAALLMIVEGRTKAKDSLSVASSQYPDTSNQSLASYHSFDSMDKEPMV
ncbi:uncharacterized protein LOC121740355 [Aricia agestis]|uniref:uncharacterized protein LOC121740355 n=1 Tax=Aricia agestis TaxID=91739 RepID=UPI001C204937|nr:uncharacterized protein LOC121740355 [Aricia agestis]